MRFMHSKGGAAAAHQAVGSLDARHLATRYHGPDDPVVARVKAFAGDVEQGIGRCHECRHQVFYSRQVAIQFPMLKICLNCVAEITPELVGHLERIDEAWRLPVCPEPCLYA